MHTCDAFVNLSNAHKCINITVSEYKWSFCIYCPFLTTSEKSDMALQCMQLSLHKDCVVYIHMDDMPPHQPGSFDSIQMLTLACVASEGRHIYITLHAVVGTSIELLEVVLS